MSWAAAHGTPSYRLSSRILRDPLGSFVPRVVDPQPPKSGHDGLGWRHGARPDRRLWLPWPIARDSAPGTGPRDARDDPRPGTPRGDRGRRGRGGDGGPVAAHHAASPPPGDVGVVLADGNGDRRSRGGRGPTRPPARLA